MATSSIRSKIVLPLSLLVCFSLVLTACDALMGAGSGSDPDPDGDYASQEQALESDDWEEDLPADESGLEPVALACPSEATDFVLFVTHTWDFSPNRELEIMKVEGQTSASSPCPFTVAGGTVVMEECHVPISCSGYMRSDDGECALSASGEALVSIEDAFCEDGVLTMTIVETINPDVGSGTMICPNITQPYFPQFPFSRTTLSFPIKVGGVEKTESVDPDLSGQFKYDKNWAVHSSELISPDPQE